MEGKKVAKKETSRRRHRTEAAERKGDSRVERRRRQGEKNASRQGREESKGPGQAPERGEYQFGFAVSLCCGVVCFCCVLRWCSV